MNQIDLYAAQRRGKSMLPLLWVQARVSAGEKAFVFCNDIADTIKRYRAAMTKAVFVVATDGFYVLPQSFR